MTQSNKPMTAEEAAIRDKISKMPRKEINAEVFHLWKEQEKYAHAMESVEGLAEALEQLLRFSVEICEDVKVSTNQFSILKAREALAKWRGEK